MINSCILVLGSNQEIMKAERAFVKKGIKIKIVPRPVAVDNSCGVSIIFSHDKLKEVQIELENLNFDNAILFLKIDDSYKEMTDNYY